MLELTALRNFMAVAEARSFSRAAAKLYVTQPAVSHQIRRLELELGVRLFLRKPEEVTLTDSGRILRESCVDLFNRLAEAETRVKNAQQSIEGLIRVGCPAGIADGWLVPVLIAFQKRYPKVGYRLFVGGDDRIRRRLHDRQLDLAIVIQGLAESHTRLGQEPIYEEEYILLIPGGSGRKRRPPRAEDVVFTRSFVVFEENDYMLRRWLEVNFAERASDVRIGHICNHLPGIIAMVRAGLGMAVLPRHAAAHALEAGEVTEVPPPNANVKNRFSLAYPIQDPMPLRLEAVLEHVRQAAAQGARAGQKA
jgi:LysR family nitrogen assimilation transcriptional regulator